MKNERILANATAATSDFDSSSINLSNFDGKWTLTVVRSASDGAPTVTIEASNDDTNWFEYKPESTGVDVTNGELFMDDEFLPRYMRVAFTSASATGTVTIKLFKNADEV